MINREERNSIGVPDLEQEEEKKDSLKKQPAKVAKAAEGLLSFLLLSLM